MKTLNSDLKRVLLFGAFDPLHDGHLDFFRQASELGGELVAVVARDSSVRARKNREPYISERERLCAVSSLKCVNSAVLGSEYPEQYRILNDIEFDIVALGYDQRPADEIMRSELDKRGMGHVKVVRLLPYKPHKFKSSYMRS